MIVCQAPLANRQKPSPVANEGERVQMTCDPTTSLPCRTYPFTHLQGIPLFSDTLTFFGFSSGSNLMLPLLHKCALIFCTDISIKSDINRKLVNALSPLLSICLSVSRTHTRARARAHTHTHTHHKNSVRPAYIKRCH